VCICPRGSNVAVVVVVPVAVVAGRVTTSDEGKDEYLRRRVLINHCVIRLLRTCIRCGYVYVYVCARARVNGLAV